MYRGYILPIGICKFCGQEKELINSHIIPKCFHQIKTMGNMSHINTKTQQIDSKNHQNGTKEPLLCEKCDNQLGILDGYANKILFNIIPKREFKVFSNDYHCKQLILIMINYVDFLYL
jgi:hypothetical protein